MTTRLPSRVSQFLGLAGTSTVCLLIYANFQERVFRIPEFHYAGFMTIIFFFMLSSCGFIEMGLRGQLTRRKGSLKWYLILGIIDYGSIVFSNESTNYISYPLRVVSKSFSVFITMLISRLWVGRKYSRLQYIGVLLLTTGILLFAAGDFDSGKDPVRDFIMRVFIDRDWEDNSNERSVSNVHGLSGASVTGFVCILVAVLLESLYWNFAEKVFFCREVNASALELTAWSSFMGLIVAVIAELTRGELVPAIIHSEQHHEVIVDCVISGFFAYVAYNASMHTTKLFGSVPAEVANNVRKVLTIVASFVYFHHVVTTLHVVGMVLYSSSMVITIYCLLNKPPQNEAGFSRANSVASFHVETKSDHPHTLSRKSSICSDLDASTRFASSARFESSPRGESSFRGKSESVWRDVCAEQSTATDSFEPILDEGVMNLGKNSYSARVGTDSLAEPLLRGVSNPQSGSGGGFRKLPCQQT